MPSTLAKCDRYTHSVKVKIISTLKVGELYGFNFAKNQQKKKIYKKCIDKVNINMIYKKCIYKINIKRREKMKKDCKQMFCMRIEKELLEKIETAAKRKDRSVSSLIRVVLKNYLQNEEI